MARIWANGNCPRRKSERPGKCLMMSVVFDDKSLDSGVDSRKQTEAKTLIRCLLFWKTQLEANNNFTKTDFLYCTF